jgi:hypothetical protein
VGDSVTGKRDFLVSVKLPASLSGATLLEMIHFELPLPEGTMHGTGHPNFVLLTCRGTSYKRDPNKLRTSQKGGCVHTYEVAYCMVLPLHRESSSILHLRVFLMKDPTVMLLSRQQPG